MTLKAGWLGFVAVVWIIGIFLGSTFDYANSTSGAGMAYTTGTATFTKGSAIVIGAGTTWNNALMSGGNIKFNADNIWYRVLSVNSTTNLSLSAVYAQTGGNGAYTMAASAGWAGTGTGGYTTAPVTKLQKVMTIIQSQQKIPLLGTITALLMSSDFWNVVWQMMTWQFSFMDDYQLFYWVVCLPIVLMGTFSMILLIYTMMLGNLRWR